MEEGSFRAEDAIALAVALVSVGTDALEVSRVCGFHETGEEVLKRGAALGHRALEIEREPLELHVPHDAAT